MTQLATLRALVARPRQPDARSSPLEVEALVAALLSAAGNEEEQERAANYLVEVATLQRDQLHDTRAAADALAQALAMRAEDDNILAELTGLLREEIVEQGNGEDVHRQIIVYEDYREIDGVLVPHHVRVTNQMGEQQKIVEFFTQREGAHLRHSIHGARRVLRAARCSQTTTGRQAPSSCHWWAWITRRRGCGHGNAGRCGPSAASACP